MIIVSAILLMGIVGLLWAIVLSLISTDGRDHNGRTGSKKQTRAVDSRLKRVA
jgi:hypothetical protein